MNETATTSHGLEFIRDYDVSVDRLWRAVTDPDEVVQWFGPEGVDIETCRMNLTQRGPWHCVMVGRESGKRFKVTGQVTHVRPPEGRSEGSVGFTWAWHDAETDARGPESHVIFEASSHAGKARLRLVHRELAAADVAREHSKGWLSTLARLDRYMAG